MLKITNFIIYTLLLIVVTVVFLFFRKETMQTLLTDEIGDDDECSTIFSKVDKRGSDTSCDINSSIALFATQKCCQINYSLHYKGHAWRLESKFVASEQR